MKKLLFIPCLALLTACGDTKPTAIEVSDLGKVVSQCFVTRTSTIDEALNPFAALSDIGGLMEELTKASVKKGWKITSEDRLSASLATKRDGVGYECDFQKTDGKWTLTRSLWDGEEAYSQSAQELIVEKAQYKQDTTWEEKGWIGETYKYYALPPKGSDLMSSKELAINCKPNQRGVMLNDFLNYGDSKDVEFLFDKKALSFGVSGGGSNSYLGDITEGMFGKNVENRVETATAFIEALKSSKTISVMGQTFMVNQDELNKVPCLSID